MNLVLVLVFLVVLAVVGKYLVPKIPIDNLFHNFLNYSGFFYLLLGVLLSPYVLNLFTHELIGRSYFVFSLVLGWSGFLIGLQLNFRQMARFQKTYYFKGLFYFFMNSILISSGLILVNYLKILYLTLLEIILLAVAGSISSTITIGLLVRTKRFTIKLGHFLEFLAAFDNVLGVIALGILFIAFQFLQYRLVDAFVLLVSAYLIVLSFSMIFKILAGEMRQFEAQLLIVLAIILVIVAVSKTLQNSVLFLTMLLGMTIANLKGVNTKRLYLLVQEWEKPLNFILMFFIGLVFQFKNVLFLTLLLLVMVLVANLMSERMVLKSFSQKMGFQTFGLSSVSMAIMLDAHLSGLRNDLVSVIVIIYFLTNLVSIYSIKKNRLVVR